MASAFKRRDRRGKLSTTYTIRFRDRYGRRLTRSMNERRKGDALAIAMLLEESWRRRELGLPPLEET